MTANTAWTVDPDYPLRVLRDGNYLATISYVEGGGRSPAYWWDVDAAGGDGLLFDNGAAPTELEARHAAEDAIRAHQVAAAAAHRAENRAFINLHQRLVRQARNMAPHRHHTNFPTWLEGYSEGVEHALEVIAGPGHNAEAFLAAIYSRRAAERNTP